MKQSSKLRHGHATRYSAKYHHIVVEFRFKSRCIVCRDRTARKQADSSLLDIIKYGTNRKRIVCRRVQHLFRINCFFFTFLHHIFPHVFLFIASNRRTFMNLKSAVHQINASASKSCEDHIVKDTRKAEQNAQGESFSRCAFLDSGSKHEQPYPPTPPRKKKKSEGNKQGKKT